MLIYLHSTMYLLKPSGGLSIEPVATLFTFHYVSIKTIFRLRTPRSSPSFTFHYVSIKTSTAPRI